MADTKRGREKQADDETRRQLKRDIREARERGDEAEPPELNTDESGADGPPECRRRDCSEQAAFLVLERYLEETGHGAVEATAALCPEHTAAESPTNLDGVYDDYVFRVVPLPESFRRD